MKLYDWHRFFSEQQRQYGKVLFTLTELANTAGSSRMVVNVEISRLMSSGELQRYARGIYGLPGSGSIEQLLELIDAGAYITGFSALALHGYVTQQPAAICCFTNRRPRCSRVSTTFGTLQFHSVKPPVFHRPRDGSAVSGPEQALCDFVYLSRLRGANPGALVTLRHVERLRKKTLATELRHYPASVRVAVEQWVAVEPRSG